ncbi:MAG TPA: tRNA epoxyqueuosine(34) reductase QueG [Pirellulales bacterium]|jgi:epoxyqueuosine reductase
MDRKALTANLKQAARRLGFDHVGATPAITPTGVGRLQEWLAAGYAGEMSYLASRADAYADPGRVLPGVRSVLVLGLNYRTADPAPPQPGYGRVSRYAWGTDYHDLIHDRLKKLVSALREMAPEANARGVVDTAPLLEREFAQLAGLGWIGKNTLLLNREAGSWFFLAALLTDLELDYDQPHATDHCGTCTACLDACPTDAFVAPYVLDSRRCVSYLTIELREAIPRDLRAGVGEWLFGCDVCQDVCPWNNKAPESREVELRPRTETNPLELTSLFSLSGEAFRSRFRQTPLWRAKRRGLLRNAAIVLGNSRAEMATDALLLGLRDSEPLVRVACAWALGQVGGSRAAAALEAQLATETDPGVRNEIACSLAAASQDA